MSSSILETQISEKTTEMGLPIGQPSICFMSLLLTENTQTLVNFNSNFLNIDFY